MFTRTTGILIIPMWLAAMGWLVANDVWPAVSAEPPPPLAVTEYLQDQGKKTQYVIKAGGRPIGNIWTEYLISDNTTQREDIIFIDESINDFTPMRVTVSSVFTGKGLLDEFTMRLANGGPSLELHGERFHADFSFNFKLGDQDDRSFKLPLTDASMISGAFNPIAQLPKLEVGQRWRMQVFNPLAAISGFGERFLTLVVEVTGKASLPSSHGKVDCFVVEAANTRAWVDANGLVRSQEVTMPMLGKITVEYIEGYNSSMLSKARGFHFPRR